MADGRELAARWWATRGAAMGAWAVAGWPVWRWYVARVGDGSDEPWGLAALVVALAFVPWRRWREQVSWGAVALATGAATLVFLGHDFLPALVRGGLWMLALAGLLGGEGPVLARAGLLLLSLPVVATAQFYLGYPLRAVTAACSVPLLRACGYTVERGGTALRWAGETVLVDAPCSGIQMLWTGLFVACALAAVRGLGGWATFRLLRCAAAAVALANVLRCTALFLVEVRGGPATQWLHEGLGLALFGAALGVVVWQAARMAAPIEPTAAAVSDGGDHSLRRGVGELDGAAPVSRCRAKAAVVSLEPPRPRRSAGGRGFAPDWLILVLAMALIGVAVRPLFGDGMGRREDEAAFPGWPETFEGRALTPLVFSEREARFAAGFPGRVGAFTDGERTILLRWVARETRKLHPALHCLRGLGYAVQPGPVWRDAAGRNWGTTLASRADRTRRVRERISDGAGGEWTDVSAWWWDAWCGTSAGPWWATTVFEE